MQAHSSYVGKGVPYLFVNRRGRQWSESGFSKYIIDTIAEWVPNPYERGGSLNISARILRYIHSTCAAEELEENERAAVAGVMGHTITTQDNVYNLDKWDIEGQHLDALEAMAKYRAWVLKQGEPPQKGRIAVWWPRLDSSSQPMAQT